MMTQTIKALEQKYDAVRELNYWNDLLSPYFGEGPRRIQIYREALQTAQVPKGVERVCLVPRHEVMDFVRRHGVVLNPTQAGSAQDMNGLQESIYEICEVEAKTIIACDHVETFWVWACPHEVVMQSKGYIRRQGYMARQGMPL